MNIIFAHQQCNICGKDVPQRIGSPSICERLMRNRLKIPDALVVRCEFCGFYYIDSMPIEGMTWLYDNQYFSASLSKWWEKARREVIPQKRFDVIQGYLKSQKPRFFEIGCGPGMV
jgi:hypothetical protein